MKKTTNIVLLATLLIAVFACKKDDISAPVSGNLEIAISLNEQLSSADFTTGHPIAMVTIEDLEGNVLMDNVSLPLLASENKYSAKITDLEPGTYNLTKFLVVEDGIVLHAVPMGFAPKSALSNNPLPKKFIVEAGEITIITPEVVKTKGYVAQDFGYISFNLNEKATFSFKIGAYTLNAQTKQLESTTASLSLTSAQNSSDSEINKDETFQLTEGNGTYKLTVSKDGYQTWTETFTEATLLRYYYSPLKVYLAKETTNDINFITDQDSISRVNVYLKSSTSNPLVISWGDGKIELANLNGKTTHDYSYPGHYNVKVYGEVENLIKIGLTQCNVASADLNKATGISSLEISRNPGLKTLNVNALPKLKELICVENSIETINLSGSDSIEVFHCSVNKLKTLDITTLPNLRILFCDRNKIENLDVSKNNKLTSLYLSNNAISNDNANRILVSLLQNVTANNRAGQLNLSVSLQGEGETAFKTLKNTYLWNISI